jgi:hypothetical protein
MPFRSGTVVLFGSGEASPEGRRAHDYVMRQVRRPIRACVLETPAGFELNSPAVAGKLASFLQTQLQNYQPEVTLVPARRRGPADDPASTDNPDNAALILRSNYLMMGPGSPTYAVRQLADSRAWHAVVARHRLGHPLVFASAVAIAVGRFALPVYEIYKVGEDIHWKPGLDLLGPYGIAAVFVPHWNNNDGGTELDTSRCFMGLPRFERLLAMLPPETSVLGIDEKTALALDLEHGTGQVLGRGTCTLIRAGGSRVYSSRDPLDLSDLGHWRWPEPGEGLPPDVWNAALSAERESTEAIGAPETPADGVRDLAEKRLAARRARDWAEADRLRAEIGALGWQVNDTPDGFELQPVR